MLALTPADQNRIQQNTESPLLKLPQELKNRIFAYVCGGRMVHISGEFVNGSDNLLCSSICHLQESKPTSYERFSAAKADDPTCNYQDCKFDHTACVLAKRETRLPEILGKNLLLSCSQVYDEARLVPFSSNVFYFAKPLGLVNFCRKVSSKKRCAVRNIHLDMEVGEEVWERSWNSAVPVSLEPGLKRLQHLSICIHRLLFYKERNRLAYQGPHHDYGLPNLVSLQIPSLKTVEVLATNELPQRRRRNQRGKEGLDYWSLEQRQEWARNIERKLLGKKE